LLLAYNGKGYYGVQIQKDHPTIEGELFPALVKVGAWKPEHQTDFSKMWFQRGSRTDKGVSAAGQTLSMMACLVPDFVEKMNEVLPEKIRIMGYIRTTKGFDAKNYCDSRTYMYMTPTFAFADIEKFIDDSYRIDTPRVERIREVIQKFVGTHNFHNFTSGVKFSDSNAKRYMIYFECSDPYVRDGIEFVTLRLRGQSFMLHQIRKMIGLTMAIVRGYCAESVIDKSYTSAEVDVPKAPGLGLVLEELHFSGYNKKWGSDGVHEPMDWAPFQEAKDKFKEEHILSDIVAEEKSERVMFQWLRTLQFHNFGTPRPDGPQHPWSRARVFHKDQKQNAKQEVAGQGEDAKQEGELLSKQVSQSAESENVGKDCDTKSESVDKVTENAQTDKKEETECSSGENKEDSALEKQNCETIQR